MKTDARPSAQAEQPRWWFGGTPQPGGATASGSPDAGPASTGALPSLSLPKGGGAIRGIDEKMTVAQATGTATATVPVFTSPGRGGFTPKLSLTYDSGAGNGPYGLGWSLAVPNITRKTSKGLPRYNDGADSDIFILSGTEDLVPSLTAPAGGTLQTVGGIPYVVKGYRPRVEASFARIERWQDTTSGEVHWRTISNDNVTSLYGETAHSRVADPDDPSRVFSWLLALTYDDRGNAVSYVYKQEDGVGAPSDASEANRSVGANQYLKEVRYGNDKPYLPQTEGYTELPAEASDWLFRLVLDYGEHDLTVPTPDPDPGAVWSCRPDPFSSYRSCFEIRTYRTCRRLLMFHQFPELGGGAPVLVRSTDLAYVTSDALGDPTLPSLMLLASATQTGFVSKAGGGYESLSLPPLEFGYQRLAIDGDVRSCDAETVQNLTGSLDGIRERWIDLDGEGLQGILSEDDGAWYYKRNVSAWNPGRGPAAARFEPLSLVADKPVAPSPSGELTLVDLNGDGNLCAVSYAPPSPGWFEYDADDGWGSFRQFSQTANIDFASPYVRFVDLDGDGLTDVLITEDEALVWYQWEVDEGFEAANRLTKPFDEEWGPTVVFADPEASISLADMSGDGLTDLVRIRNGEVCYWPNLGYGRFGAKVTMDDAPAFDYSDRFDARRIRLADIDGSGTADLVYLGTVATMWFNQSGNGWTRGTELSQFPSTDPDVQATVFDLLGTGTACLVWTSPLPGDVAAPLRYIDLTGGVKPHLLTSCVNNLGATTTLTYAPSTKFYLRDRAAGAPWVTRLPFPVHVVERVQIDDSVSGTSYASTYSYHHGFYDGVEREFRGFARVETLDADTLPAYSGSGAFTSLPPVDPIQHEFQLAPTLTKTWYHTGAFFGADDIAARLAEEYWALDTTARQLGPTAFYGELPPNPSADVPLTAEELREACRALRGRVLRQEVYAVDKSTAQGNPYVTSESRCQVDMIQPPAGGSYGAFYAWQREAVTYHYERDPADPRVSHDLSLAIDAYGNVLARASVAYPRRNPGGVPLPAAQSTGLISYRETDYVNADGDAGWYRLGLPTETRTYELTGVELTSPALLDPDTLLLDLGAAQDIPFQATPTNATVQRRLLSRQRVVYMADDLTELPYRPANPVDAVDSLGLVYQTYSLHSTRSLLDTVFTPKLDAAELAAVAGSLLSTASGGGGFVDLDSDQSFWAPASRLLYSDPTAPPDPAAARAGFYLPVASVDPWGNLATVTYDAAHTMFATATKDAAGNTTEAQINYRLCRPWLLTDPNSNRAGARFDALGRVVATAAMGKALQGGLDEGDHLDTTTSESASSDDPSTKVTYRLATVPVSVQTEARVLHQDPNTPWLQSYVYTDGLGRVALAKVEAEPEPGAPAYTPDGPIGRWVGTGKVVYDNKGNPVKAYEPFFDTNPDYTDEPALVMQGVTSVTRYDPLGRVYRVDNPNGTFRTVTFTPWQTVTSDENDTVKDSEWYALRTTGPLSTDANEAAAVAKALPHYQTPMLADFDVLGRAFRTTANNGAGAADQYMTTLTIDIRGRVLETNDARGRNVLTKDYDIAGGEIHQSSVDGGDRWLLTDAGGQLLQAWDSRDFTVVATYDLLRRRLTLVASDGGGIEHGREETIYGEGAANAQTLNLRGAVYRQDGQEGRAMTLHRDFKGNITGASRQLLDWSTPPQLTGEVFTWSRTFDALGRVLTATAPDNSVTRPVFNERSLLAGLTVEFRGSGAATAFVDSAAYDAKGQRQNIAYANGATTEYTYDEETFRLAELKTTRAGGPNLILQDLAYTYDPVGNITHLGDAAQQANFYNNQQILPDADYTYDAIYRLVEATGREHALNSIPAPPDWNDSATANLPSPSDVQALVNYKETYVYDEVGNFQSIHHTAGGNGWTRSYSYADLADNRLTSTAVGSATAAYTYDAHGNVVSMPHLTQIVWDWKDQLQTTSSQLVNDGTPETTGYRYDVTGQRAVKASFSQAKALRSQRIYLGGYEIYREYDSTGKITLERDCLHVSDGAARICLVETTVVDSDPASVTPSTTIRYQLGNHLGSAVVELDQAAAVITYEEYYPYGATSFQGGRSAAEVSLKRYRYTGKERDAENGFYYHGARYYAPWLGRWTACDPAGLVDGPSLYAAVRGNPVRLTDPSGTQSQVDAAKQARDAAQRERDQAAQEAQKLSNEAIRLDDRQGQLLKQPAGESAPQRAIRLGRLHQVERDLEALHPKLTAAFERSALADTRYREANAALTQAQNVTSATPDPSKQTPEDQGKETPKKPSDSAGTPPAKVDAAKGGDTKTRDSYVHVDVQALGTYNAATKSGQPAFGSFDPQITVIPVKDWSPLPSIKSGTTS